MQLIRHPSEKDYRFVNDKKQCIIKVSKSAIPCFNTDNCFYFLYHDAVIKVVLSKDDAVMPSLSLYVNKRQVLHFSDETPENEACLSVYDKLPSIISIVPLKEMVDNKWLFIDYRDEKDIPPERIQKNRKNKQDKTISEKISESPQKDKNKNYFRQNSIYKIASWPKIDLLGASDLCFENERS